MEIAEIKLALIKSGINPGDTLMIHGDAIVASQLKNIPIKESLNIFYQEIISYLGPEGTLVIPTFTYSFTRAEDYNVIDSKSKVGLFSEYFRNNFPSSRTKHPIFSVAVLGKYKELFLSATINDCFGENTIFDILFKLNAKISSIGCDITRFTFTHFIEQKMGVNYRYFKYFKGDIIDGTKIYHNVTSRYYVGNLNIKYNLNLNVLKKELIDNKCIHIIPFGRVAAYTVSIFDYYKIAAEMLKNNSYSLIDEGYCE